MVKPFQIDSYSKFTTWYNSSVVTKTYTDNNNQDISFTVSNNTGGSWYIYGVVVTLTNGIQNFVTNSGMRMNNPSGWYNNRSALTYETQMKFTSQL